MTKFVSPKLSSDSFNYMCHTLNTQSKQQLNFGMVAAITLGMNKTIYVSKITVESLNKLIALGFTVVIK